MLRPHPGEVRKLTFRAAPAVRLLLACFAVLALAPCGPGEDLAFPRPTPAPGEPGGVPVDGRQFGYIRSVNIGRRTLGIDLAEFLTGDAADKAAADAGEIEAGEEVPNDYFIDNGQEEYVTIPLARNVTVRVVGDPPELVDGELGPFAEAFAERPDEIDPDSRYRGVTSQYWVTVRNGQVTAIEEQYLP